MFIYKSQLKDVKSRKETTLQISARNTNSRKIAANTVFSVLGNSDVQRGLLKIRVMACGSECRGFESHRTPKKKACKANTYKLFCFLARYSIANTGQRGTLRILVRTAGILHNKKMEARSKENQMT